MSLAETIQSPVEVVRPSNGSFEVVDPERGPLVLNPAELRQLRQAYRELLELHHAEVVEDEQFENARRLLRDQVLPLRQILKGRRDVVVDATADLTY